MARGKQVRDSFKPETAGRISSLSFANVVMRFRRKRDKLSLSSTYVSRTQSLRFAVEPVGFARWKIEHGWQRYNRAREAAKPDGLVARTMWLTR